MNQERFETEISRLANNGKGVGLSPDGLTAFVDGAVPGDRLLVETVSERKRFREARVLEILRSSPQRIVPDCPDQEICGGCCFRQMTYACELEAKHSFVQDAFRRIGGFDVIAELILPSPGTNEYRNKVEFAIGRDAAGKIFPGFYSEKTHQVVPVSGCRLIRQEIWEIAERFCQILNETGSGQGLFQLILRESGFTGEVMLVLVSIREEFIGDVEAAERIRAEFPCISSVILNTNYEKRLHGPGLKNRVLSGNAFIRDRIGNVPVEIGPLSFFQVNTPAAELLYQTAAEYAAVQPEETVLDLYCGMGTIGLSMASGCRQLIGGEIVDEAVKSAARNAAAMGLRNTRFLQGDAAVIAETLIREKIHPDLIILDPPRKGCSPETLQAVLTLAPSRIVMVSCDPATAARDCRILCDQGFRLPYLRSVDLFPRTRHVESVVSLTRAGP